MKESKTNDNLELRTKKFLYKESLISLHEQVIGVNNYLNLASVEIDKIKNKLENMSDRLKGELYSKTFKKELDRNVISVEMNIAILLAYTTAFRTLAKHILNKKEV